MCTLLKAYTLHLLDHIRNLIYFLCVGGLWVAAQELALSFYYVRSKERTQVVRVGSK